MRTLQTVLILCWLLCVAVWGAGQADVISIIATSGDSQDLPQGLTPQGGDPVFLMPGEIETIIVRYSFDALTAAQLVAVRSTPFLPEFIEFAFNAADRVNQTVTIQYRLTVATDAPGGEYDARIVFDFLNSGGGVVVTREQNYPIIINAPPPPDDFGDDCETAFLLDLNTTVMGRADFGGDLDFFSFQVTDAGTATISTTGPGDTVGALLGEDCTELATDDNSGFGNNFLISQQLEAGTYHISVRSSSVNTRADFELVLEFQLLDPFVHELYFAQFGNGSGFSSQLQLLSTSPDTDTSALIEIRDDSGNSISNDFAPAGAGEDGIPIMVPAGGIAVFETDGAGDLVSGSVVVRSDLPLSGVIVFGGNFGLAGVSSSPEIDGLMIAPVQMGGPSASATGLALQNLEDTPLTLEPELLDRNGVQLATAPAFQLPANGHAALFVNQINWSVAVDFSSFVGVVRVRSQDGRYSATVLLQRPGQLASLTVLVL